MSKQCVEFSLTFSAQQSAPTSAADPYNQPNSNAGYDKGLSSPAPGAASNASARSASPYNPDYKSAGNASQYGQGAFGSDRYGNENGYSTNVYGKSEKAEPQGSRYGPSGYGGLGSTIDSAAADANREALFGYSNQAKDSSGHDPPPYGANSATPSAHAEGAEQGYGGGAYQDRQLTAEEEEEEEVSATKQEVFQRPLFPSLGAETCSRFEEIYPLVNMMLTISTDQIHQVSWPIMAQDLEVAKTWNPGRAMFRQRGTLFGFVNL